MNKNLFAALAILAIGCLASASAQTVQVNQQNRTIEIAATSSIQVTADRVTISAGYHNYGPTHDAAFAENARVAAHILKALTDAGIAQRNCHKHPYFAPRVRKRTSRFAAGRS